MSEETVVPQPEKPAPPKERLGPFSCKLEKVVECLSLEADSEEEANNVRELFLLHALYYVDDDVYEKGMKTLIRKGYSKRLIRAADNLTSEPTVQSIAEALLDSKLFNKSLTEVLPDHLAYFNLTAAPEAELKYLTSVLDFNKLTLSECVYGIADFNPAILALRVPGGAPIDTDSRFGKSIEKLLENFKKPQHSNEIRQAFVRYAVGLIDRDEWSEALKPFKRQFSTALYDRVLNKMSDNILDMFGKIVKFGYEPEAVCEYVGKVTLEDYNYILTVLGETPVTVEMLIHGDEIEPMIEEKEEDSKEETSEEPQNDAPEQSEETEEESDEEAEEVEEPSEEPVEEEIEETKESGTTKATPK